MIFDIPTTTIAFQGGAYGNYLHWILYILLTDSELISLFKGSTSHDRKYLDQLLIDKNIVSKRHSTLKQLSEENNIKLSTIHPVNDFNQDFTQEIKKISNCVEKVIIPYIDHSTYLLGVHNYLFKIWNDIRIPLSYIDRNDLYQGWGINTTNDLTTVPTWILREYYSMNIFNSWESQCGWFAPTHFYKPNCKFIFISDLIYNFLDTIENIRIFLDVEWKKDPQSLLPYHKENISAQKYIHQDILTKQILNSVFNEQNFHWQSKDLTIYSEAYIQRILLQQGIVLKCNGLNLFPTSTETLVKEFV